MYLSKWFSSFLLNNFLCMFTVSGMCVPHCLMIVLMSLHFVTEIIPFKIFILLYLATPGRKALFVSLLKAAEILDYIGMLLSK